MKLFCEEIKEYKERERERRYLIDKRMELKFDLVGCFVKDYFTKKQTNIKREREKNFLKRSK